MYLSCYIIDKNCFKSIKKVITFRQSKTKWCMLLNSMMSSHFSTIIFFSSYFLKFGNFIIFEQIIKNKKKQTMRVDIKVKVLYYIFCEIENLFILPSNIDGYQLVFICVVWKFQKNISHMFWNLRILKQEWSESDLNK